MVYDVRRKFAFRATTTNPSTAMNDSELDRLLRDCGPDLNTPPDFRGKVWNRIEAAESAAWKPGFAGWLRGLLARFALPPVALATCAVTIIAGAWFGMNPEASTARGETAYVRSISPFAHSAHR